jgi:membrane protease YdiL (CAAX protease family)
VTPLRRLAATYPITVFCLLAFTSQVFIVATQYYEVRNHGLSALRIYTPALAALAVGALAFGWKTAWKFIRSLFDVKVAPKYYLFALVYPSFVGLLALVLLYAVGAVDSVHLDLEEAGGFRFFSLTSRVALVEEIAWIGFVLTVFAARYRLFQAGVFTGLIWGLWYIPLVFANIQVAPGLPIAPLVINFMTIAAICAWLYLRTGSAFVVFLMQLTTNYTSQIIPVLPLRGGVPQYVAFVLMKALFGAALYLFWGPKPMFGRLPNGVRSSLEAAV